MAADFAQGLPPRIGSALLAGARRTNAVNIANGVATACLFAGLADVSWLHANPPAYPSLCSAAFIVAGLALAFQLVLGSLTRNISTVRLLLGIVLLVWAAAALLHRDLSLQGLVTLVTVPPFACWYGYWGWHFIRDPPHKGEAIRPARALQDCSRIAVWAELVGLVCEFFQLVTLPFNPALGTWDEIHGFSDFFGGLFQVADMPPRPCRNPTAFA
eukprot:6034699-Pleurochrysis_carterae.AAC.2